MPRRPAPPPGLHAVQLGAAIDGYFAYIVGRKLAKSTVAVHRVAVNVFLDLFDDTREVWTLRTPDFDAVLTSLLNGPTPEEVARKRARDAKRGFRAGKVRRGRNTSGSRGQARSILETFVAYCHRNKWLSVTETMQDELVKPAKEDTSDDDEFLDEEGDNFDFEEKETGTVDHKIIPYENWEKILKLSEQLHMRLRIAMVLGLYLGRRISEVQWMRWGHIDWDNGTITFKNIKRGREKKMPLYPELREELEKYRRWIVENYGIPQRNWYLVPGRLHSEEIVGVNSRMGIYADPRQWPLKMTRKASKTSLNRDVRRLFQEYGYGPNMGTGTHTMRRSAAVHVALTLGLEAAQYLLDHQSPATTHQYVKDAIGEDRFYRAFMGTAPPKESTPFSRNIASIAPITGRRKRSA